MSVTTKFYDKVHLNRWNGGPSIDWTSDVIKVALCTSSYTPAQATHEFFSDITNEITGTGYTAGGKTVTTPAVAWVSTLVKFSADNVSWPTATFTARYAIIYKDTGTAGTSPLIAYVDFGTNVSSAAGTFLITWDATGILTITPA